MPHEAKNFDHLLGKLAGFSDDLLKDHFGLYKGYVTKLNEIEDKLGKADRSAANYSYNEYSELKRRECVPLNGTYLHELYFENLAAGGSAPSEALKSAAAAGFGTWDDYVKDCRAAAGSTPGWVITTYSRIDQKLHNYIMFEHHMNWPVYQEPIMALDCWEHAFMRDYGTKKPAYLDAFFKNVSWAVADARLAKASKLGR